ncbi:MAG: aminotransferase class III-fold pyridoxal phosphate-dependent enzyme, partial [Candidatus Omnitrophica bacterium]|nr:aminotransferase class III-fold pyridoxal phosphate-dependent enzyme [Candidatus Omnitrophota bacterium]
MPVSVKEERKSNSGIKLWNEAKKLIPGGNQLLSKRAEMFLPDGWPAYYKKARGVEIWDLDDNRYIDMSIMGMGTCVLGYAYEAVDRKVRMAIDAGSMSTLNCPEEVDLAKRLIELHPWAQNVRFARTGGEACAIAIRIARAFTKRDKVLFCGYHGWPDWYLAANLTDGRNLDGQLLPDLAPLGVPRALKETSFPFNYGDLNSLKELVSKYRNEIGVIILEFARTRQPDLPFLMGVRQIASEIGSVLIFDEITSGFRMRAGGMHMLYGIEPDLVILGKAMGNGYPISAVLGKEQIMDIAQGTFISSTFWSERIGFSAACAVIEEFELKDVSAHLLQLGTFLTEELKKILSSKTFSG